MTRNNADDPRQLTPDEISFFFNALVSARDGFGVVARVISKEYGIGRRGPWMIGVIGRGPVSPNELATRNRIGRSLVSAELNLLQTAGLIRQVKNSLDGRRVELSLTLEGAVVYQRLADDLASLLRNRLGKHSRQDINACAQMLSEFGAQC